MIDLLWNVVWGLRDPFQPADAEPPFLPTCDAAELLWPTYVNTHLCFSRSI